MQISKILDDHKSAGLQLPRFINPNFLQQAVAFIQNIGAMQEQVNMADLCLPSGTEQYRYEGKRQFLEVYHAQRRKKTSLYFVFFGISLHTYLRDFQGQAIDSFYPGINCIVVKMKTKKHDWVAGIIHEMIHDKVMEFDSSARKGLRMFGQATYKGPDRSKEADLTFVPKELPANRSTKWPSFVVEVGWSESERKLKNDAKWWLTRTLGDVKRVLTIKVNQKDERITMNSWTLQQGRTDEIDLMQSTVISRDNDIQPVIVDNDLEIPFADLYLRPARTGEDEMIVFNTEELVDFATDVWAVEND